MSILIRIEELEPTVLNRHIDSLTNLMSDHKLVSKNDTELLLALNDAVELFNTIMRNSSGLPLLVRKQVNYGIERFSPTDDIGKALLTLTGKTLFDKEEMRACKSLGFNIELAREELNLEDTDVELKAREKLRHRKPRTSKKLNVKDTQTTPPQSTQMEWFVNPNDNDSEQVA